MSNYNKPCTLNPKTMIRPKYIYDDDDDDNDDDDDESISLSKLQSRK